MKIRFLIILLSFLFIGVSIIDAKCDPSINGAYLERDSMYAQCSSGIATDFQEHNKGNPNSWYWTWKCGSEQCVTYRLRRATPDYPVLCGMDPGWCIGYPQVRSTLDNGFWGSNQVLSGSTLTWTCEYMGKSVNCSSDMGVCGKASTTPVVNGNPSTVPNASTGCQPSGTFRDLRSYTGLNYMASGYLGYGTYGNYLSYRRYPLYVWACLPTGIYQCMTAIVDMVNGACGSNAKAYPNNITNYSGSFCSSGVASPYSPSFPAQGSSINWICSGQYGGSNVLCTASRSLPSVNGTCGTNATTFTVNQTTYTGTFCSSGTLIPFSPAFPALGSTVSWSCAGSNGGSTTTCTASRLSLPSCGISHYNCNVGTPSNGTSHGGTSFIYPDGSEFIWRPTTNYKWGCDSGGASVKCTEIIPYCGYNNGVSLSALSASSSGLCGETYRGPEYKAINFQETSNGWTWQCVPWMTYWDGYYAHYTDGQAMSYVCYTNTNNPPEKCSWIPQSCGANKASINGVCGTNATTLTTTQSGYTGTFCDKGSSFPPSPVFPEVGGVVSWVCMGINGGTNVACSAKRGAPGACGSAVRTFAYNETSYGTYSQCSTGTPSSTTFPSQGGSTSWTCSGINGGPASTTCTASRANAPQTGACGSAAKTYAYNATAYTGSFCNTGTSVPATPTFPVQGATINWVCNGLYGGGYVLCDAKRGAPGACGSAVRTFAYNETSYGTYSQCSTGTPSSTTFPSQGGSTSWTCSGINGGPASTTCTASRANAPQTGACGSAAKTYAYNATAYTGSFCNTGTSVPATPTFPVQGATINWVCNGLYGGGYVLCDAKRGAPGACGSAVRTFAYNETSYGTYAQCSTGTPSSTTFPSQGGSTSWTCSGINGGPASTTCTASRANAPQTGACGSAAKTYAYNATAYTGSFCNTGTSVPATPTFPVQGATINWICNGLYGGGYVVCSAKRDNPPACVWTCNPWSLCINGTQSRSCSALPIGCVGSNPEVTTRSCTNIVLNGFLNPLDLATKASTMDQKEQCLWCDYYYQDGNTLALGKAGALDFRFVYNSPDGNMKKYEMAISASSANNPDSIPNSEKIVITRNISVASGQAVNINGISVSRTISKITGNTLPYDNKTYRWWVRVTNDKETSPWIEAVNKSIYIPDHQWPTPAIGGLVETRSSKNEFLGHTVCSTMVSISNGEYQDDPCYQSCWSDYQKGTAPIVGDSRWKCSVCYSTNGNPKLCTNDAFEWGEVSSSIGTFNNATNTYKEKNKLTGKVGNRKGRYFPNPIIKFIDPSSEDNKLKLKVMGSECPLEASVMAKLIRPVYIER
ncbi:hypothetical protein MNSC_02290 [Minisyncoccus archaeophilus]|uniref:hypothetical protein n=1 Tax=Minisyncoccus archaeiphilus TaxID=3238481 RepID=UPI00399C725F